MKAVEYGSVKYLAVLDRPEFSSNRVRSHRRCSSVFRAEVKLISTVTWLRMVA